MSEFLQKLLNNAKNKVRALEDELPIPDDTTAPVSDTLTVSDTKYVSDDLGKSDTVVVSDTANESDISDVSDTVFVKKTRASSFTVISKFNFEIVKHLPPMPDSAIELYLYFYRRAYRKGASGIVKYNQRDVKAVLGFSSHTTIVRAMSYLERNELIKWEERSFKKNQVSKIRVLLPKGFTRRTRTQISTITVSDNE